MGIPIAWMQIHNRASSNIEFCYLFRAYPMQGTISSQGQRVFLIFVGEPFVETGVEDLKELGCGLHILKSSA